jgi:hypothetical protein
MLRNNPEQKVVPGDPLVGPHASGSPIVHMAGVFDADNFGDALFPLVARRRLGALGYEVAPVSHTGRGCGWPDAMPSISLHALFDSSPASAGMLIGGGNIIAGRPLSPFERAMAGLWLGASLFAVLGNVPLLWNSPGVPRPFLTDRLGTLARAAVMAADRVAVRDADSRRFLGKAPGMEVDVAPDTAIELAALWPKDSLAPVFHEMVQRKSARPEARFLGVHLRVRGDDEDEFMRIGSLISAFAQEHSLTPLLIAIGPAARDDVAVRRTAAHLTCDHVLLDDPRSLKEIAAALAFSVAYVGQSLHGAIAAAAYGVPGILVSPLPAWRFRGFLASRGKLEWLAPDWRAALAAAAHLPMAAPLPPHMYEALDVHWRRISEHLGTTRQAVDARFAFLQAFMRHGALRLRSGWILHPLLRRSGVNQIKVP